MLFIRCPYCHKIVFRPFYARHKAKHTERLPDGQMSDHISLQPKDRYQGSLQDVPCEYHHPHCDVVTGMPEEIIRSYLANPFLYSESSFCCGCEDYVPTDELFWVTTGQSLADYNRELQEEYLRVHGKPPPQREV